MSVNYRFITIMARSIDSKCRKCRRAGEKLFLKGDRCDTSKCAVVRKAYPPGVHGKRVSRGQSEYGKQLSMKQKIKRIYGVMEKQFRNHLEEASKKKGVIGDLLMARLEMRLDNAVYRIGFANSRSSARQLVSHGLILVNGKKNSIPSFEVKVNDVISISETKKNKTFFVKQSQILKEKKKFPAWLEFDSSNFEGKVRAMPTKSDTDVSVDVQAVIEFYSR